jgi:DNA repair protein RecO (recombination protein O)
LLTSFAAVREDFTLSACGSTMAEAVDRVAQEDERSNRLFLLLLEGLRTLVRVPVTPASVLDGFLLRLASVAGYHPYLDACAECATPGRHGVFSIAAGGALCTFCAPPDSHPLDASVIDLLQRFSRDTLGALADLSAEPRTRRAAGAVVNSFLTYHLGRPLQAWELVPR